MKNLLKILLVTILTSISLFASNFSYVNKIFNLDLSKSKLENAGKSLNHEKYFLIDRTVSNDYSISLLSTFAWRRLFQDQTAKDPKEMGGPVTQDQLFNKIKSYLDNIKANSVLENKIVGDWVKIALYASDDIDSLDNDIKLVEKEVNKEIQIKENLYKVFNQEENLNKDTMAFLWDTRMFGEQDDVTSYETLNPNKIIERIRNMDFEDFEEEIESNSFEAGRSKILYSDLTNGFPKTNLMKDENYYYNVFFWAPGGDIHKHYETLLKVAGINKKRLKMYLFSDLVYFNKKLKSIDYILIKKVFNRWNEFSKKQKIKFLDILADHIQNVVAFYSYNVNTKGNKVAKKFYNLDLYKNPKGTEDTVKYILQKFNKSIK